MYIDNSTNSSANIRGTIIRGRAGSSDRYYITGPPDNINGRQQNYKYSFTGTALASDLMLNDTFQVGFIFCKVLTALVYIIIQSHILKYQQVHYQQLLF